MQAGLEILDREGIEAVTMRGVAAALGVTPMALYNHVSSKDDLLRNIAAHILDTAEFNGDGRGWRAKIEHCFAAFRAICLQHPALPGLLEQADMAPVSVFAPMEVAVAALRQAGLGDVDALRTYFALVSFTLSQAAYQARGPIPELVPSAAVRSQRLAGRGYITLEALDLPADWDFDAAFAYGVRLILDGVEAALSRHSREKNAHVVVGKRSASVRTRLEQRP